MLHPDKYRELWYGWCMIVQHHNDQLLMTDAVTGEVKIFPMATGRQMKFIRSLERELGREPKNYRNLTVWQASKVINRLKSKQSDNLRLL